MYLYYDTFFGFPEDPIVDEDSVNPWNMSADNDELCDNNK